MVSLPLFVDCEQGDLAGGKGGDVVEQIYRNDIFTMPESNVWMQKCFKYNY